MKELQPFLPIVVTPLGSEKGQLVNVFGLEVERVKEHERGTRIIADFNSSRHSFEVEETAEELAAKVAKAYRGSGIILGKK